jgi:hypothetical protein
MKIKIRSRVSRSVAVWGIPLIILFGASLTYAETIYPVNWTSMTVKPEFDWIPDFTYFTLNGTDPNYPLVRILEDGTGPGNLSSSGILIYKNIPYFQDDMFFYSSPENNPYGTSGRIKFFISGTAFYDDVQFKCTGPDVNVTSLGNKYYVTATTNGYDPVICEVRVVYGEWYRNVFNYDSLSYSFIPGGVNLSAQTPQVLQQGLAKFDSSGTQEVSPGAPVQVVVPIAGSGFNSPETRTTTVQLQVGSQPIQSQTISLADVQLTGTFMVPFNVIFKPQDVGPQTITATVDPGNALGESNFTDNTSSVQVKVVPPFKLVAFLDGSITPIPDEGGNTTLIPSIKACGQLKDTADGATDIEIRCVQAGDPAYLPVSGCKFVLDLSQGPDSGGHTHNANDETRPFVLDPLSPSFPVGQFLSVDSKGNGLTYTPPEVAGDVLLQIAGTDPNGNQIAGPSYLFHVQDTDLGNLVSLNGVGSSANNPGISVASESHPGAGIFGTQAMQTAVSNMVEFYYENADDAGVTNPPRLASEAATLIFGGLFDANWNGSIDPIATPWSPPHCGHRDGVTIDLSLSQFTGSMAAKEKTWLQLAARSAGLVFTNPAESPKSKNANHWHTRLRNSQ